MKRRRRPAQPIPEETLEAALCRRAVRFRRKGDQRRALVALRQAAHLNEHNAKLWVLYGAQCLRSNKRDAAEAAFNHAAWLHERHRHPAKAAVTRSLLHGLGALLRAA